MQELLQELSKILISKNIKLVTVESCTGGWVAKSITDLPGSSKWYESGFVTYSNKAKQKMVGVDFELFEKYGAVSKQVAHAMASGACHIFPNCVALSITGIAGPEGGSDEKPVGLVYLSIRYAAHSNTIKRIFKGERENIRLLAVSEALSLSIEFLKKHC